MDDQASGDEAHHATFDTSDEQPTVDVTETVGELKGVESDRLSPLYDTIDHVLDNLFSEPPRPDADVEISFTYEGFRITVCQDGNATFRPVE